MTEVDGLTQREKARIRDKRFKLAHPGYCREWYAKQKAKDPEGWLKKKRENCNRWNAANPERRKTIARRSQVRFHYGLKKEDYEKLLQRQGNKCGLCGGDFPETRQPSVDHDHKTGEVRGILCHPCNALLGMAKERIDILTRAMQYLQRRDEKKGRYYFSCVEQMVLNPQYDGYLSFRVEVFDKESQERESGHAIDEASFLVPEAFFGVLYDAFDGKEADLLPSITWEDRHGRNKD